MKGTMEFLKTTALGGLLVVLPLMVFYLLVSELLDLVVALAMPLVALFPDNYFARLNAPLFVALLLILGASFLFGLALRSQTLTRFGHWIDHTLLEKLPMYGPVKRLSRGLAGAKEERAFGVALLRHQEGFGELVYVIEENRRGMTTVLVPMAPTGFNGPLKLVPSDSLVPLDASLGDASQVMAHWGVGLQDIAEKTLAGKA